MPAPSKREHIINQALALFYQYGFHATGIDKIIKHAAISKKTLYNHFHSKDELILATLRKRDELFRNNLIRETERLAQTPRERLLAVFDVMDNWFKEESFAGCMFINATAEFSHAQGPNHMICAEHKRLVRNYIKSLAEQAGARHPEELAYQLNMIIEGAIVHAHVEGDLNAAKRAKGIAQIIINLALDSFPLPVCPS